MTTISDEKQSISESSISLGSYEEMAEYYFKYIDEKPFNAYYERPATIALLPEVKSKNVLDAGCAAGWYTNWLLEHGANVTALDFSPAMIEVTKKRVGNRAKIINADLNEPLNFIESESMDVILSSLTLHYIKNWDGVMSEFNRILKKNGQLIISVHHPFMDFTSYNKENYFLTELLDDEWTTNKGKVKIQFYRRPLNMIINSIIDSGFVIEKLEEPMPTEDLKTKYPEIYNRLTTNPQFLFIRSKKN